MENEVKQEPIYLDYGSNKIDQNQFFTRAADNVYNWVNSQSWSHKRKEKFLNAYSDLMSKGITGASNTSGQWELNLSQKLNLDSMPKKDQEMYHEAAYYILQQMSGITPKETEEKKKEEEKKDLPLFDNKYFTQQFQGYIGNQRYGGRNYTTDEWNNIDQADSVTGIRGTSNRAKILADMLEGYSKTLEDGKQKFEGTAHTDLNDLKSKISNAVQALRDGTWDQNDVDALNRLGINPETYMSTGANDQITLQDGTVLTRQQAADAYNEQQQKIAQAEALKKQQEEQAKINANAGVSSRLDGIFGHEAKTQSRQYNEWLASQVGTGQEGYNNVNTLVQSLLEKGYTQGLNQAEKKQLGNLLYHIRNNNPTYQGLGYGQKTGITQEEFNELLTHKNLNSQNINDYIRLPWQTSDGRNIYADNKGSIYYVKPKDNKKLNPLKLDRSKINEYRQNYLLSATEEGKRQLAGQRGLFEGGLKEKAVDTARMTALGEDIASAIAAFVPEYGTAISAGLSLDSLKNDFIADALDDSVSTGQMLGNAAINLGLGVVGLIPGVKIATRMGKWGKAIGKLAPQVLSGGLIAQQALSQHPQVLESWKKAAAGKDLTINDWKNIGQSLRWISGGVKVGKATHNTLKYGKTNPGKVSGKEIQTTKNGKASTAKITNEEFETLNSKKTLEDANKFLQSTEGGKGHTISEADFKTGRFRNIPTGFGKTRRRIQGKNYTDQAELTPQQRQLQQKYTAADAAARQRVLEGRGMYRFLPQRFRPILANAPTNYQIYGSPYVSTTSVPQESTKKQYVTPVASRESLVIGNRRKYVKPESSKHDAIYVKNSKGEREKISSVSSKFKKSESPKEVYDSKRRSDIAEVKDFKDMYLGTKEHRPGKSFARGYGSSKVPEVGEIKIGNVTLKLEEPPKSVVYFRNSVVKTLEKELGKVKKDNLKEYAHYLRLLKSKGWLKSGGKINSFDLNGTISEFLNKQK